MNADLATTLASLTSAGHIVWSKVADLGALKVTVTVPVAFTDGDPNNGYDNESKARHEAVGAALAVHGLYFIDGGIEENGSGEFHVYRAA